MASKMKPEALGLHLKIKSQISMKKTWPILASLLVLLSFKNASAQLIWEHNDTIGGMKRGSYIFPSPGGVYVLTDQNKGIDLGPDNGKSHVLHISDAGMLNWEKRIDLGSPDFEQYGFWAFPKIDFSGNLVFRKIQVFSDNFGELQLEKFHPNGIKEAMQTLQWGGNLDFGSDNKIYSVSGSGGNAFLQTFTEGLVSIGNVPVDANGQVKVLNSNEFYLIGNKRGLASGKEQIYTQKINADGGLLWESTYPLAQAPTALDHVDVSTNAVDAAGSIYLLIRIIRANGIKENIVTKTSPEGIFLWSRQISASSPAFSENTILENPKLVSDDEGNCYLAGTILNALGTGDAFICKFGSNGEIPWSKRMAYNLDAFHPVGSTCTDAFLKDGSIYLTGGYYWSENILGELVQVSDFMALKINIINGNLEWKATYLDTIQNTGVFRYGHSIIAIGTDSVFVTGVKNMDLFSEVLTVCFKSEQNTNGNLIDWAPFNLETTAAIAERPDMTPQFSIFPNPATETITLELPEDCTRLNLSIYSVENKLVQKTSLDLGSKINVHQLPSGFYLLYLETTEGILCGKMVKN